VLTLACHELIGLKEVHDRDRLVAAGTQAARTESAGPCVALLAALLAEEGLRPRSGVKAD
jgi:hypothetical protein